MNKFLSMNERFFSIFNEINSCSKSLKLIANVSNGDIIIRNVNLEVFRFYYFSDNNSDIFEEFFVDEIILSNRKRNYVINKEDNIVIEKEEFILIGKMKGKNVIRIVLPEVKYIRDIFISRCAMSVETWGEEIFGFNIYFRVNPMNAFYLLIFGDIRGEYNC